MFTLEQTDALHARLGKAETLLEYVRALRALGVDRYESFLTDGHSAYFGSGGHRVVSPAAHEPLTIAATSDRAAVLAHLKRHEQGQTTYLELSRGLAGSGVEKWTVDMGRETMTYSDLAGKALLVEKIGDPDP